MAPGQEGNWDICSRHEWFDPLRVHYRPGQGATGDICSKHEWFEPLRVNQSAR